MTTGSSTTSRVWLLDAAVGLWIAAWVAVGIWVGVDLHHLDHLAADLGGAGQALGQTAQALHAFTHLPLVGHDLAKVANGIASTGQSVQANASATKSSVDQLSYLLAVVIVVIPSASALGAYLPWRVRRRRAAS
ncbi:MAG: hypothetical protein ACRDY2_08305 [Acidimicrobiales bacterium]